MRTWALVGAVAVVVAACGNDTTVFGNGGGGVPDGGNTSTGGTSQGGAPVGGDTPTECESPADCPISDVVCADGACVANECVVVNQAAGSPCPDGVCDGQGQCVSSNGAPCGSAAECASGLCVDGVCCDQACDGACEACDVVASEGTCTQHDPGTDPEGSCAPGVCDGSGDCAVGNHLWSHSYGNAFNQYLFRSAVDAQGNVIMTGYFEGAMGIGNPALVSAGLSDIVLAKLDPNGALLWAQRFGDGSSDFGWAVETDAMGNIYAAGYFYGSLDLGGGMHFSAGDRDIYLAKFDANGSYQWSKRFGDSGEQRTRSIAIDANGNIAMAGWFASSVNFGGATHSAVNGIDAFVARFDDDGNFLASTAFGGSGTEEAYGVGVDAQGNVLVAGNFGGTINLGGGAVASSGSNDAFIAKLDSALAVQWSHVFGDGGDQYARTVQADAAGNVVATGYFTGSMTPAGGGMITSAGQFDAWVAKLDANGASIYNRAFGNGNNQLAQGAAIDSNGNVIVTGSSFGNVDFGGGIVNGSGTGVDAFLVKLSSGGEHVWSYLYGSNGGHYGWSVNADPNDDIVITGYFSGNVDFGGGNFNASSDDAFVAKFAK